MDAAAAVENVEQRVNRGGISGLPWHFNVWWLEHYATCRADSNTHYRRIRGGADCVIYALDAKPRGTTQSVNEGRPMNSIGQILNDVKGLKEREARLRALLHAADLDRPNGKYDSAETAPINGNGTGVETGYRRLSAGCARRCAWTFPRGRWWRW